MRRKGRNMEMKIRPMKEEEWKYTYRQSQQLTMQTGSIGCLRADFGQNGNEFYSTWTDHRIEMKTDRFTEEFDRVINALRTEECYGGLLRTRSSMNIYCNAHSSGHVEGNDCKEHGFRVDTEGYAYLLRLNPNRGDYNVYCHCYQRHMLDDHLRRARKGIRFIDPAYQTRFVLPDGEKIRITRPNGEKTDHIVRFIDGYHLEVHNEKGNQLFHICEFAERMDEAENIVIPIRSSLPERCFSVSESSGKLIMLERGEPGYKDLDLCKEGKTVRQTADEANAAIGVSKRQEAAMLVGSLFGWEAPGADPRQLDEQGRFIYPKERGRDEER